MIDVPNAGLRLRPGMTATTTIEIARRDGVVRVPNTVLRFRPTTAMFDALGQPRPAGKTAIPGGPAGAGQPAAARHGLAWVWANGRLAPVTIRAGITDGTYTEILEGAPPADTQLVTTMAAPTATTASSSVASPLMQQNGPPPGLPPGPPGGPR